jgi:arylsulfatase A-like enzyme/tetratricopeptide (TPR) repeat protein
MAALPRPRPASLAVLLGALVSAGAAAAPVAPPPAGSARSVLLITLDTTRADALGAYGARRPTPALDGLAARGTRYTGALTASPLTLPAHTSLLTGLDPPQHGVLDNGIALLRDDVPTLASVLAARGYATAAFVASRVLDRRFGLARGFATYDDRMAAEQTGEYGYPERDAQAVTGAALAWLASMPRAKPFFLWVHYYDPHAPYQGEGADDATRYAGEVAAVDRQVARLLAALPQGTVIAAVGDHGEALGEHGEHGHGLFLYESVLHVPLILAGPGVPRARVVDGPVASRRLAPTLAHLAGAPGGLPGDALPGLGPATSPAPVYSETWLAATAYGWSPLRAWSDARWRYVDAPRPELYDVVADPGETRDRSRSDPQEAARLRGELLARAGAMGPPTAARAPEAGAGEALRSLGYLSGASGRRAGTIDPKDGLAMLAELVDAKRLLDDGRAAEALPALRRLCERSPGNVPFLGQLARAQADVGDQAGAVRTLREARDLNPESDFVHVNLGQALRRLGQDEPARASFEDALARNPRSAAAWMALAEMARDAKRPAEEEDRLRRGIAAGTQSATMLTRLAQIEMGQGKLADAGGHLREATALLPDWSPSWLLWGAVAERGGQVPDALARYEKAVALAPRRGGAAALGRLRLKAGAAPQARRELESAARLAPGSAVAREARRLLEGTP